MGFLSSVDSPVGVQAGAGGESLAADVTHVRPLPCVGPDVSLQQTGSVKLFATSVTRQHGLCSSDRNWSYLDLSVIIPQDVRLRLRPDLTDGGQLGGAGGVTVPGDSEQLPGEVQGLGHHCPGLPGLDEGLQVALDDGLSQHLDGGQEDAPWADRGQQMPHQLLAPVTAPDHLKHQVPSIIPLTHHVDIRPHQETGLQEPDPVTVTDQLPRLLLDLIMEPILMLELKLAKEREGGQEFCPHVPLQGVEGVPLLEAPCPRHQCEVLASVYTRHQLELRGTEYRCLHGMSLARSSVVLTAGLISHRSPWSAHYRTPAQWGATGTSLSPLIGWPVRTSPRLIG